MAQTGWYNSLSGFLGQRAATDPVPEGPRSDGDSTQRVDSLLERWRRQSQVPTGTKNPTGKPRVLPGPGKPAYAWLGYRDPLCAVVAAGPRAVRETADVGRTWCRQLGRRGGRDRPLARPCFSLA